MTTTKQVQSAPSDKPQDSEAAQHVEKELEELQQRWSDFRGKVAESRKLIELSIQYFQLVEEVMHYSIFLLLLDFYLTFVQSSFMSSTF